MAGQRDQMLFMTVPPTRSGDVVASVRRIPGVVSASAVYSGIDVVAQLSGTDEVVREARRTIDNLGAPIDDVDEFEVGEIFVGPRFHDSTVLLRTSCRAYIRCVVDLSSKNTLSYAAKSLQTLKCAVAVYCSEESPTLILEVLAADKGQFDYDVMAEVQGLQGIVKSTRSYIVINTLSWTDWVNELGPAIFMSLSDQDNGFATALKRQINIDTGLRCWKYDDDIPQGAANWPSSVDGAMRSAPLHLYLLSKNFLRSGECQREFGQSLNLVAHSEDICSLLIPGFDLHELDARYRERNCIVGDKFFAYSHLLKWIHEGLSRTGGRPGTLR